ncbi:hypothetical protein L873DRAFT_1702109, partial [Choiromyces venosus 120613-1]
RLHFMQDGSVLHRVKKVKQFLTQSQIYVLSKSASSPNLNPIQNAWYILKQRLQK